MDTEVLRNAQQTPKPYVHLYIHSVNMYISPNTKLYRWRSYCVLLFYFASDKQRYHFVIAPK